MATMYSLSCSVQESEEVKRSVQTILLEGFADTLHEDESLKVVVQLRSWSDVAAVSGLQ